ncbi:MAG TPA: FAD-linked oxidase C-terminal domain-containing protein [Verrucomicrobiales bacterium]|nr:FAD-linked oxidase C-terminal domain-containing protein [Verrucomicrobiales bacterium]
MSRKSQDPLELASGASWTAELAGALPPGRVTRQTGVLHAHSGDKWHAAALPEAVVRVEGVEEAAEVLRFAHRRRIPVTTRGAGVGYVGGCVPVCGGIVLSTMAMNRIREIDRADGVAVVEPGVITGELQDAARRLGMFYPPDPASLRECSIGGNIATNAGGPRCLKYGVTRHYVLGLEVVLAGGRILRTGGRCHKNKTGFDLLGMFVGSEGLLGVVTEATLRLLPHPPARAMVSAGWRGMEEAAAAVQAILGAGYLPSALEIADRFTLEAARAHLGASLAPQGGAHLLVEVDGHADTVGREAKRLSGMLAGLGALQVEEALTEDACERIWGLRREFSYSLKATGLVKLNEDVVVPRRRLVDLAHFAEQLQAESGFPVACFGHAGDGNLHVNIMVPETESEEARRKIEMVLDRLFCQVLAWGGTLSGEHGIGLAKKRWFEQALPETAREVHRELKRALDPRGILNPGKFVSG